MTDKYNSMSIGGVGGGNNIRQSTDIRNPNIYNSNKHLTLETVSLGSNFFKNNNVMGRNINGLSQSTTGGNANRISIGDNFRRAGVNNNPRQYEPTQEKINTNENRSKFCLIN
jgi:hypothetical protein